MVTCWQKCRSTNDRPFKLLYWSYKVVKFRYPFLCSSQNQRDLPRDIPLDSVVVLRYEKKSKSENKGKVPTKMELVLEQPQQEHQSDTKVFTMTMEILLEPTSNKLMIDSILQAGNPVKEILLKLNLPDHRILKDGGEDFRYSDTVCPSQSDEVLKLKNIKKDASLKLFKLTNQERYENVSPKVTSSQDGKVYKMEKRDYAWLVILRNSQDHIQ
ncbi:hypothetical protein Tco_1340913, partial [Tanacetum coccineum]